MYNYLKDWITVEEKRIKVDEELGVEQVLAQKKMEKKDRRTAK
jgi:hypothetical protein